MESIVTLIISAILSINIFCGIFLSMIQFSEIKPNEVVKVLVNCDDIEEEIFARVVDCFTTTMMVRYFEPIEHRLQGRMCLSDQ